VIKLYEYGQVSDNEIFDRSDPTADVSGAVRDIIAAVRENGDRYLLNCAEKYDHAKLDSIEVSQAEIDAAFAGIEPEFLAILEEAAANIRAFHEQQLREGFALKKQDGIVIGQKIMPIEKVGLCVPGGVTPLSSTVLMNAIPAKLAGCSVLVMMTPANPAGRIDDSILAAAKIAGVDRIFKAGGAQGVAALAYGTESVPRVDKIVGPGGAFVAEAKRQVFGQVAIDMIAGPSEILIVADENNDPKVLAADMLSQAEHDKNASAVLITVSRELAEAVSECLEAQIPRLPRHEIARASIDRNGKIIVANTLEQAVGIANRIAPEHLELCVDEPFELLKKIRHAGSVFLGHNCPEALGDYFAGANHTLPTSGTARFSSPLSVDDFIKKTQFIYYSGEALESVGGKIAYFAEKEGLSGHARSAVVRFQEI